MLQGRLSPPVVKMRDMVAEGRLGRIMSVNCHVYYGLLDYSNSGIREDIKYLLEKESGGNLVTIMFVHSKQLRRILFGRCESC